ncbi:MAG TPA: SCO family protein [Conexibacter sp.]
MSRRALSGRALALVVLAAVALAGCGSTSEAGGSGGSGGTGVDSLPKGLAGKPATTIALTDARSGARFDTASLSGKPYLVTFLYTSCPDVCPLIGQEIREALAGLGSQASDVAAVAVSVDPRHDTPAAVQAWLRRQHQPEQFHYLIGSEAQLAPAWRAFYAAPQIAGDPESAHTAVVWVVDRDGKLAGKVDGGSPFDPSVLTDNLRALLST